MTNLTPAELHDSVSAPDEGEEVTATTGGAGKGPVRPGYQGLLNQLFCLIRGRTTVRALTISAPGNADVPVPTDGNLDVGNDANVTRDVNVFRDVSASRHIYAGVDLGVTDLNGAVTITGPKMAFTAVHSTATGGNPPALTAFKNEVLPLTQCKNWIIIRTTEVPNVLDGACVALVSVAFAAGVTTVIVTLSADMATAVYLATPPMTRLVASGAFIGWATFVRDSVHQFTITYNIDLTAANYEISLLVFGRQN